jgi:hypothetical protein
MNRIFKKLLVWLLVALLPLQAVAGSFGMTCAPVHQQSSQDVQNFAAVDHDMMDDAHASHGSMHAAYGGMHADQASSADGDTSGHHAGKLSHSSCSACSAFCLGAVAPPSYHLPAPTFDGSDAVIVSPSVFAVAFIQDGPQRPPRQ